MGIRHHKGPLTVPEGVAWLHSVREWQERLTPWTGRLGNLTEYGGSVVQLQAKQHPGTPGTGHHRSDLHRWCKVMDFATPGTDDRHGSCPPSVRCKRRCKRPRSKPTMTSSPITTTGVA